jgi:hypothetical protein
VEVEKGFAEAQIVKKKHLDELKGLEQPDPEWLLALRKEDEEEEQLKKVNE